MPQTRAVQEAGLKHESLLLVPWQPSVHDNTRQHWETGLFCFTAALRDLIAAAGAVVRTAGPACPH